MDWLAFAAFHAGGDAEDMRRHSLDHRSYGNGAAPPRARDNKQGYLIRNTQYVIRNT